MDNAYAFFNQNKLVLFEALQVKNLFALIKGLFLFINCRCNVCSMLKSRSLIGILALTTP